MNIYADKVWGTFFSLPFSLHQTVEVGAAPQSVFCNTPHSSVWLRCVGKTRVSPWYHRNSADVQVWSNWGKRYSFVIESAWKGNAPRWCGQIRQALLSKAQSSAAAMAWGSVPRLTNTAQISCQSNFTASTLVLAHSSALRQQSIVPQRPAQRGSFGTPISALQRDAATPMSRGPGGLGMIHWHDESGTRAVWKLWHHLADKAQPSGQQRQAAALPKWKLKCGHSGSRDHPSPWWWAHPSERSH